MDVKRFAQLYLYILILVFLGFFYVGITVKEPIGIDYILPIAKSIISGEFLTLNTNDIYLYSPGSSNAILSLFLLLNIPINLFGLLSWVCLFIVCKKLGDTFGLNRYMAFIFAATFCTTISVVRTISDQSIDKWLCTWFVLSIILLEKLKNTWKHSALIGFSLGMLIGTKYSGPLFLISLIPIYIKPLLKHLNIPRFLLMTAAFTIFGLFWYIRNYIIKGNPYFPAPFLMFKGPENFTQQGWHVWKLFVEYPAGLPPFIDSLLSEYMIWSFSGVIVIWFVIYTMKNKLPIEKNLKRVLWLTLTTGIASIFMPIAPPYYVELFHTISNMRYIYIFMLMLMLAVFLIADKYKKNTLIATIALLNAVPLFSFIPYLPKVFIFGMGIVILLESKFSERIQKNIR